LLKNCVIPSALEHISWQSGDYQQERKNFVQSQPFGTYSGDPREFRSFIDQLLSEYDSKYGKEGRFACEFSGGIDSSIIAGHYAIQGKDPLLVTAGFPGEFGDSQQQKIDDFKNIFKTEHLVVPLNPERHFPLSHMVLDGSWRIFYEENELYYTTFDLLAAQLQDRDISIVYDGLGGDDALARFDFVPPQYPLPSFFNEKLRKKYEPKNHTYQDETFASQLDQFIDQKFNCNNTYIAHDIWPVAPFTDPRFILYAQSLAPRYRDNKNIFRMYCDAWQYPESVFHPEVNETFDPFLKLAAKNFPRLANQWLAHSKLATAGLVDLNTFNDYTKKADTTQEQLTIVRLLIVEINLQLLDVDIDIS
jgi:asparagine synthetase B (glutamine-hydrolysing)